MDPNASVRFFDAQVRRQIAAQECRLNPFEAAALPQLRGAVDLFSRKPNPFR